MSYGLLHGKENHHGKNPLNSSLLCVMDVKENKTHNTDKAYYRRKDVRQTLRKIFA